MSDLKLAWGANVTLPEGVAAAWGARLIWPDDLVWDRQSSAGSDEGKAALETWLNSGRLKEALAVARQKARDYELRPDESRLVTLWETDRGIVVANPQSSHGYLYVAAWLKH